MSSRIFIPCSSYLEKFKDAALNFDIKNDLIKSDI